VGNRTVRGVELPTDRICASFFRHFGFVHIATLVREISNKRMPAGTMKYEYIVILQKSSYNNQ
jgi:site-specific DNA-methyltransferase (cytosine-N4-specific)